MNPRFATAMATGLLTVCIGSQSALAQLTLPYSGSCNPGTGSCFVVTNTNSSGAGSAIQGDSTGALGVLGADSTSGTGVEGDSATGYGVYGDSVWSNGVFGNSGHSQGVVGVSTCSTGGTCIGVYGTSTSGNGVWGNTSSSTNAALVGVAPNPGIGVYASAGTAFYGVGNIQITGTAYKPGGGSWTATSDRRVKKDVNNYSLGLTQVLQVRPIRFKYNGLGGTTDNGKEFVGVIAQDLEKILPSMVGTHKAKLHTDDKEDSEIKEVDPSEFTYLLINAVQEQQRMIQRQEARINELEQGRPPLASSMFSPGGIEAGLVFGALPFGLIVAIRRKRARLK